ncbi:MAG: hypothetical protein JSV76_02830 [Candidatus Bathyarchaeota archaeon]|nr:MAG: hypothetical protein JSV76_02830 [Candidatus Bathyarchaeota archaeon]
MDENCEVRYVDSDRVTKHFIRELEGVVDIHYHHDPRTIGVYTLPLQAKMWEGEYVETVVDEQAAMLGVITEVASHHPRARLYLNGTNQTPQYLDTFCMGQIDGLGCIKWFLLPTGKMKKIRLQVTGNYNPIMPRTQRARSSGFCFGGFIIKKTVTMPVPVHASIAWSDNDLNSLIIPKGETLAIADMPHPSELQYLQINCDSLDIEVNFIDGWSKGTIINPTLSIRINELYDELAHLKPPVIHNYATILRDQSTEKSIAITAPLTFMAGMHIRVKNLSCDHDAHLHGMRGIAKVRLC